MKTTQWIRSSTLAFGVVLIVGAVISSHPRSAQACGCLAPPTPAEPVLQAGERILFAVDNGQVLMHVQIQYSGNAKDFGWLVPLPSEPTVAVGTDELFAQLEAKTGPQFLLNRTYDSCGSPINGIGCGADSARAGTAAEVPGVNMDGHNALVVQDSIGPYNYAVLKADDKTAMLTWLNDNHYSIPTGTDAAVDPYIQKGAFFLALRLASGKSAGDIQPIVLKYQSDYPMIPVTLTSVGAQPNMGVAVWVLGGARAIPRNYSHTIIDEAAIDWINSAANYPALVTRAVGEAPGKHSFVTEFAGKPTIMQNVLNATGRFGDSTALSQITDVSNYLQYLSTHGFLFTGPLVGTLQKYIPMPQALIDQGVAPSDFYSRFDYWRANSPQAFNGVTYNYDAAKLTTDIWTNVVTPTLTAGALFSHYSYLTYLYTTLSPEDMNADPVFGFNADLGDVNNLHQATLHTDCDGNGVLTTDANITTKYPHGAPQKPLDSLPGSMRIETLRETGAPTIVTDNTPLIQMATSGSCSLKQDAQRTSGYVLFPLLLGLALVYRTARRRLR